MVDNTVQLQTAVIEKIFLDGYPQDVKRFTRLIYNQFGYSSPVPRKATLAVGSVLSMLRGQKNPLRWIRVKPRLLEMVDSIVQKYKASHQKPSLPAWPCFTPPPPSPTQDLRSADAFIKLEENPEPQPVLQPAEQLPRPIVDMTDYIREIMMGHKVMMTKVLKKNQMFRRAVENKDRRVKELQTTVIDLQKMQRELTLQSEKSLHQMAFQMWQTISLRDRQIEDLVRQNIELRKASSSK